VARERSAASNGQTRLQGFADDSGDHPALRLTRAQAHALRRSAPLTPTQFKSLRQLAEQGINPLRRI